MRLNQFIAASSGLSRRAADAAINSDRVSLNGLPAKVGQQVAPSDLVMLDGQPLELPTRATTILFNKPVGYVCSRNGQGNQTIYDLLPAEFQKLKTVGRLDKDSSGLLLLTDDGNLANQLLHPRNAKEKVYQVALDKPLSNIDEQEIEQGIKLDDYISRLSLDTLSSKVYQVTMTQGHNRQIRRTFEALGYEVKRLHRVRFGDYTLGALQSGNYQQTTTLQS